MKEKIKVIIESWVITTVLVVLFGCLIYPLFDYINGHLFKNTDVSLSVVILINILLSACCGIWCGWRLKQKGFLIGFVSYLIYSSMGALIQYNPMLHHQVLLGIALIFLAAVVSGLFGYLGEQLGKKRISQ